MTTLRPLAYLRRVYCAGPLFNDAERCEMIRIAECLRRHGFETFLPHADGMEFSKVQPTLIDWGHAPEAVGRLLHEAIFALDIYHVAVGCGSLVLNLNGRVPDEGAVAEATIAWMLGKPIVIYKEDVRSMIAGRDNPLVVGQTGFEVTTRMDDLGPALEAKVAKLAQTMPEETPCPVSLQRPLDLGGQLWQRLELLGAARPADKVALIILEIFAGYRAGDNKTGPRLPHHQDGVAAGPKKVY